MRNILRYLGLCAALCAMPAHALTWSLDSVAQAQFDDNLFRRPGAARQSDRIMSIGSGLLITLPWKVLDANFEGHLTRNWFANSDYLNNLGYSLSADVKYRRKAISVEFEGTRNRKLSDFSEIYENIRNMQTVTILDGRANVIVLGNIRAVAGGSLTKSENSNALTNGRGYTIKSASAGLGYYSPSDNYLALLFQRVSSLGIGSYPIDVDGQSLSYRQDFSENRINLILHYQPSALLLFETQASYVDRNDHSLFRKNFNGLAGKFSVDWKPRRSIDILTTIGRQLQSDGYVYSDSIREDYINVTAKSRVTRHLGATLGFSFNKQHFVYDIQAPEPIEPRTDHFHRIRAGLSYDISRRLELGLDGHREWRSSTNDQFHYSDDALILSLHVKFGAMKPLH